MRDRDQETKKKNEKIETKRVPHSNVAFFATLEWGF
jgi:hypothetical protein